MSTTIDHSIEAAAGVSLAEGGDGAQGADVRTTMIGTSANGLSLPLLDELAMLAAEKVRAGEGLRLMGEGGILPELRRSAGNGCGRSCANTGSPSSGPAPGRSQKIPTRTPSSTESSM